MFKKAPNKFNFKIFKFFDHRGLGSIFRTFISSLFVISFFYSIPVVIYYLENNPYLVNNMEPFFYTKSLPKIEKFNNKTKIKNIWIVSNKYKKINQLPKTCKLKYSTYPDFIFKLNENWKRLNLNWYILYCN